MFGLPLYSVNTAIPDPSKLKLSGWWRSNWSTDLNKAGVPSLGTSGTLLLNSEPDDQGSSVNGHIPALFVEGGFGRLNSESQGWNNTQLFISPLGADYLFVQGWTLLKITAGSNTDSQIWGGNGGSPVRLNYHSLGGEHFVRFSLYAPPSFFEYSVSAPVTLDTWSLVQYRWRISSFNGGLPQSIRVNNGEWVESGSGPSVLVNSMSTTFRYGRSVSDPGINHEMLEFGFVSSDAAEINFDHIRLYCNDRYGISV